MISWNVYRLMMAIGLGVLCAGLLLAGTIGEPLYLAMGGLLGLGTMACALALRPGKRR